MATMQEKIETEIGKWTGAYLVFVSVYVAIVSVAIMYGPLAVSEGCARNGLFHIAVVFSPTIQLRIKPFLLLFPICSAAVAGTLFLVSYLAYEVIGYSSSEPVEVTPIFLSLLTVLLAAGISIIAARKIDSRIKSVIF
ncbi:MAG: hypothetical protein JRG71_10260 [Deltaproteobacteria bacterium]|nr:hypothetical protein [Deltaproteobacteria bacterium]